MQNKHSYNRGQSMIELLVAISIVVVSLLGIFALINRSLGLNRVNSEQYIGAYLASEGIEITKNLFDHSFLETQKASPGSDEFYGWTGIESIEPTSGSYGVYEVTYSDAVLTPISCPSFGGVPTEAEVRKAVFDCGNFLTFDSSNGLYSYEPFVTDETRFKRLIIIDRPTEYSESVVLDYRVTSVVGWESRGGGEFMVHLQDHFLPWRIP